MLGGDWFDLSFDEVADEGEDLVLDVKVGGLSHGVSLLGVER